jgi:hypothetical protein
VGLLSCCLEEAYLAQLRLEGRTSPASVYTRLTNLPKRRPEGTESQTAHLSSQSYSTPIWSGPTWAAPTWRTNLTATASPAMKGPPWTSPLRRDTSDDRVFLGRGATAASAESVEVHPGVQTRCGLAGPHQGPADREIARELDIYDSTLATGCAKTAATVVSINLLRCHDQPATPSSAYACRQSL